MEIRIMWQFSELNGVNMLWRTENIKTAHTRIRVLLFASISLSALVVSHTAEKGTFSHLVFFLSSFSIRFRCTHTEITYNI